ncbi:MAG: c-type cytochrome [Thiovulaceae bacterium]|nr:c-type cytochrome [Sulfurimonadaceae bacterium]MCW9026877.1 c-type cytochrome [Sulfurimonadaceae bacterium]
MKKINKKIYFIFLFPLLLSAYDAERGKKLYFSAKCNKCHDSTSFTNKNRKVKNYKQLTNQVEACRYSTNADWFDSDRDDVVHYLNKEFYKFNTEK